MGNIETMAKVSSLKSIASIEDNYLDNHRRCSIKICSKKSGSIHRKSTSGLQVY